MFHVKHMPPGCPQKEPTHRWLAAAKIVAASVQTGKHYRNQPCETKDDEGRLNWTHVGKKKVRSSATPTTIRVEGKIGPHKAVR